MRLRAFTLMEVTVALLLTGILVVLAYGITGSFTALAERSARSGASFDDARQAGSALANDLDRYAVCREDGTGIRCEGLNGTVRYTVDNACLVRELAGEKDTLGTNVISIHASRSARLMDLPPSSDVVDRIELALLDEGDTLYVALLKWYDARTLLDLH